MQNSTYQPWSFWLLLIIASFQSIVLGDSMPSNSSSIDTPNPPSNSSSNDVPNPPSNSSSNDAPAPAVAPAVASSVMDAPVTTVATSAIYAPVTSATPSASPSSVSFVRKVYAADYFVATGSEIIGLSGQMKIPPLPHAGVYYLWPGLTDRNETGVFQSVLDGRKGSWSIGNGWCCQNPSLPWGSSVAANVGDMIAFNYVKSPASKSDPNWRTSLQTLPKGQVITNDFALAYKSFNRVSFAIELYNEQWDFGPLTFRNVNITFTGTNSSWCNNYPMDNGNNIGLNPQHLTIFKPTIKSANNITSCIWDEITLKAPM